MAADGTWNITLNTPMGAQPAKLVIADGATEGRIESGTMGTVPLEDLTAEGDDLSFKASVTSPMPMVVEATGTVSGDEISGSLKLGSFGNAAFSGTREA